MIISLHLPKTAGGSFGTSLKEYYGKGLVRDYANLPINTSAFKRNKHALKMCILNRIKPYRNVKCIHGHFLPLKYRLCKNTKFVTWMRDPIERLASHYYFWLRTFSKKAPLLHKRVIEEKWSLERFCLSPELRNFYSQFLWGFPVKRFDFIGITEHYETELEYFSKEFLGTTLQVYSKHKNREKKNSLYFEDKNMRNKIERYHSKDVSLYKRAVDVRLTTR